jgi:hypothetical protein
MPTTQPLPASARRYIAQQRRELQAAVTSVSRLWSRMGADFDASYAEIEPQLLAVTGTAQARMASGSQVYVPAVMAETEQVSEVIGRADVSPLIGVDGSGRPMSSLLYQAVVHAKSDVGEGIPYRAALRNSRGWLSTATGTALSDTGRQSESLGMGLRSVGAYVRVLVPPSCSRCVVLAGARYDAQTAFQRHPGCDCRNIPADDEATAAELTLNPQEYFLSLSDTEQDATFGLDGADAIRAGADVNQVVNARRGMSASQVGGRAVLTTSEGTTRRGMAYTRLSPSKASDVKRAGTRYGTATRARAAANRPRLMPETIRAVATDQADYLRLLRANGYLR